MTQPTPQPRGDTPASRDIVIGATVYGVDNARFGQVAGSYRNYVIVERGFFMPVDYYVPMAAIGRVDQDLVVLSVSRDVALTQGWERPPFTSETGQRGRRRPAVGRSTGTPGTPGAAAGRQRTVSTGTNPNGWPAVEPPSQTPEAESTIGSTRPAAPDSSSSPVAPASATVSDEAGRQPDSGTPARTRKETTAISPTAAFADTYAVGTNTDSYETMTDFRLSEPAGPAAEAISQPDPMPVERTPVEEDGPVGGARPATDAPAAAGAVPDQPADRNTSRS